MTHLKLFFLGSPRLERDGQPVSIDTRKAVALLAYLAVTGQRYSRDSLAALLYPDYDQSHARASLRRTLSALKSGVGESWLNSARDALELARSDGLWSDVGQFRALLAQCRRHGHGSQEVCSSCLAPLEEAVALFQGDFLAGFSLRDSVAFDEWQSFEAERLRRELISALERLVRLLVKEGRLATAIEQAQRLLSIDPLHEPAHRVLMLLYAWTGQPSAALRQYRDCVRVLSEELSVAPLPETTALYDSIIERRIPPPPTPLIGDPIADGRTLQRQGSPIPARMDQPSASTQPSVDSGGAPSLQAIPLIGRDGELAILRQALDRVRDDGVFFALVGEPGIGKTRLAEAFIDSLDGPHVATIRARCFEGEAMLAYGLFVDALRASTTHPRQAHRLADVPDRWLTEAGRLLPELLVDRAHLTPAPPLDNPGARSRFYEGIYQTLVTLSKDEQTHLPSVFLLDDLQWADEASLDVLAYMVRRLHGRPVFLLTMWRQEASDACRRLSQIVQDAERAAFGRTLALSRLGPGDIQAIVDAVTQTPGGYGSLGEQLYRESEGLPLFVVEYLAAQRLEAQAGTALAGDSAQYGQPWTMPHGVRSLLQSRLATVDDTERQLLTTAAAIGRSFDFDILRTASGRSEEETITCLEQLVRQGLVRESAATSAEPAYDFSHEQLRAVVYEETSLARRRLLHRRVAEALARQPRSSQAQGVIAGQIGRHYQLAGHDGAAAGYFRLAGEYARSVYANGEALDHFRTALALGYHEPAELHEAIGDLHTLSGSYTKALGDYETAAALVTQSKGSTQLAAIEHKLALLHHRQGKWELAESHFQEALTVWPSNDRQAAQAGLLADRSLNLMRIGAFDQAKELAGEALRLASLEGDRHGLARAHNALALLARSQSDLSLAERHLAQSLSLAESLDDPAARVAALNNLALVQLATGEIESAVRHAESALALCRAQGDRHREAALLNNLADLFHANGQTEEAMAYLKQAVAIFAEIGEDSSAPQQPEVWKLVEW